MRLMRGYLPRVLPNFLKRATAGPAGNQIDGAVLILPNELCTSPEPVRLYSSLVGEPT